MAKRAKRRNERTSKAVAADAGRLLNGTAVQSAEQWLRRVATDSLGPSAEYATTLLAALRAGRAVAASALTQR